MIKPALCEPYELPGVAELLIDWLICQSSRLSHGKPEQLGKMIDWAEEVDEGWGVSMALAMGDNQGISADRSRWLSAWYCVQWLAFYGRNEVMQRRQAFIDARLQGHTVDRHASERVDDLVQAMEQIGTEKESLAATVWREK